MSAFVVAFGGKADMTFCSAHVCFWPKADIGYCWASPAQMPWKSSTCPPIRRDEALVHWNARLFVGTEFAAL